RWSPPASRYANPWRCRPQRHRGDRRAGEARSLCRLRAAGVLSKAMVSPRPIIFDRARQRAYRARAAAFGPSTFLIERVAGDRLAAVLRRFDCALDLGTPTGAVRRVLAQSGKVGTIIAAEAAAGSAASWRLDRSDAPSGAQLAVAADEEVLPFRDASLDLVVS